MLGIFGQLPEEVEFGLFLAFCELQLKVVGFCNRSRKRGNCGTMPQRKAAIFPLFVRLNEE